MKKILKPAFIATIPVMAGYIVLGFGFGIILKAHNFSAVLAVIMSLFIYAGSMQYAAIGLFTGGASLITAFFTTLMVNARHLFYGVSMLEKYKNTGLKKPYLIFALTDETYSLVCAENNNIKSEQKNSYYFWVSFLNHCYWVGGTLLGAVAGSLISFNSEGIDFALTALFLTVFIEQWLSCKNHIPAVMGVLVSVICLIIFTKQSFLVPAMLVITLLLILTNKGENASD